MLLLGPPRAPGCFGGRVAGEGELQKWGRDHSNAVNKHQLANGRAEEDEGRIRVSLVSAEDDLCSGRLGSRGTPSHESQEAFSEERSKNYASASRACFFLFLPKGLFAAMWYLLHCHPCPIQPTFLHFLILLTAVVVERVGENCQLRTDALKLLRSVYSSEGGFSVWCKGWWMCEVILWLWGKAEGNWFPLQPSITRILGGNPWKSMGNLLLLPVSPLAHSKVNGVCGTSPKLCGREMFHFLVSLPCQVLCCHRDRETPTYCWEVNLVNFYVLCAGKFKLVFSP